MNQSRNAIQLSLVFQVTTAHRVVLSSARFQIDSATSLPVPSRSYMPTTPAFRAYAYKAHARRVLSHAKDS
jgi:hypothetical protein